jgi:hypothetical protein
MGKDSRRERRDDVMRFRLVFDLSTHLDKGSAKAANSQVRQGKPRNAAGPCFGIFAPAFAYSSSFLVENQTTIISAGRNERNNNV